MNCEEYRLSWNDRLDARAPFDLDFAMAEHEGRCESCRRLGDGFGVLSRLLPVRSACETVSDDLADRVLDKLSKPAGSMPLRRLAVAASLLVATTLSLLWYESRRRILEADHQTAAVARSKTIGGPLAVAFNQASRAAWGLARETTAPAARVGSDVLGSSESVSAESSFSFALPSDVSIKVDSSADALRRLGQRVNLGSRPLSGTARSAFGFLLGTSKEATANPPQPRSGA